MARVAYLSKCELQEADRDLLERDINLNRALAHSTSGSRAFWTLGKWIRHDMKLDPRLRELAILQIGLQAKNAYEFSHHVQIGMAYGVSAADIDDLLKLAGGNAVTSFSELDLAVVQATRESVADGKIGDGVFATLKRSLPDESLVELCITISFYIGAVHLLANLEIDVEPEYGAYLTRFPLPTSDVE